MDLKIGCDPELFVLDEKRQNMAGWGMIPGTKKNPHRVNNGAVQVDGTALEFNTDPASTVEEFTNNIHTVLAQLRGMIPAGYTFSERSHVSYDEDYFLSLPDEARELGCDPDYNAWTGGENIIPDDKEKQPFRTASGHIHIGWTEDADPFEAAHFQTCCAYVKELDATLGLGSVMVDQDGFRRRQLYGKAGAFRPKPYGVEYRVLSNFWVYSDDRIKWVYKECIDAFNTLLGGRGRHQMVQEAMIYDCINQGDHRMAENLLQHIGKEIPLV